MNRLRKSAILLATCFRLGLTNVFSVFLYRLLKRVGYYRYRLPLADPVRGPFFTETCAEPGGKFQLAYFSHHELEVASPPDWFLNPWSGSTAPDTTRHWSRIPDFISGLGDIKTVWELSRFDWLPCLAWRYREGEHELLGIMELWLRDWCRKNPPNGGINWKCGQEAALRCLNLLVAALAVDNRFKQPEKGFLSFLETHLQRIVPTLRYAMAQDNNHVISEAAALYVAGHYLARQGNTPRQRKAGFKWAVLGRRQLENRIQRLIAADGSFAQHSLTYHRMVIDELACVELFRRKMGLPVFSTRFYLRMQAAVDWLAWMVDPVSGDGPNLGANDGTCLFNLKRTPYRDFRPSLQLGAAVFLEKRVATPAGRHPLLELFGLETATLPLLAEKSGCRLMRDGGYAVIRRPGGSAILRLPIYRFRPSHADALHLDIWHDGINWSRDCGSYSYNTEAELMRFFPGTAAHSTVAFDQRDQMPRLGRFLFGAWLQPKTIDCRDNFMQVSYQDKEGACHQRDVQWSENLWVVTDTMAGFRNEAVIRWHLPPLTWHLNNRTLRCDKLKIEIETDVEPASISLASLPESRFYLDKHPAPTLEIRCLPPCNRVETRFIFKD